MADGLADGTGAAGSSAAGSDRGPGSESEDGGAATHKVEVIAAVVLGFAAVLTAFAAYRGALTDDLVLKNYAESQANITQGNDWYASGYQNASLEQTAFFQYATELLAGNDESAQYLYGLMSPGQQALIDEWGADAREEAISPFSDEYAAYAELDSQYDFAQGDSFYDQAEQNRIDAEDADDTSDIYELSQVFFAVTLFVAGVAALLRSPKVQVGVLTLGIVMLLAGSVVLVQAETA
jgi:hypothetical protein